MKGNRDVLGEKVGILNGSPGKTDFIAISDADEAIKQGFYLLHKSMEQLLSSAKHRVEYIVFLDVAKELAIVENNERRCHGDFSDLECK